MSDFFDNDILGLNNMIDHEPEFIPLISEEEENHMNSEDVPEIIPILPLRNNVLFPGVVIQITIGRDKSIKLIEDAFSTTKIIGVLTQVKSAIEDPGINDFNRVGTVAQIIRKLKMPDGSTTIIIQGKKKISDSKFCSGISLLQRPICCLGG